MKHLKTKLFLAAFMSLLGATAVTALPTYADNEWGPERETYTWEHPADKVTINSITDNPTLGDERNFVRVREYGTNDTYSDNVNIDILPLDYDILDDVDYDYGVSDNFFAYSTRGCPRKCKFCAVQTLEPEFINTNHLKDQIEYVRNTYGDKRHIMMMDNNVIFSKELEIICRDLNSLGFIKDKATYIPPNPAEVFYKKIKRRITQGLPTWKIEDAFYLYLVSFAKRIKKADIQDSIQLVIQQIEEADSKREVYYKYEKFIVIINILHVINTITPIFSFVDNLIKNNILSIWMLFKHSFCHLLNTTLYGIRSKI